MFHVHRHGGELVDGLILFGQLGHLPAPRVHAFWIPYFIGILEPLLLDLGIDLGLEITPSPERRDQLVSPRGVARADLRERERVSALQTSVFTFAHTDHYLGFECDAARVENPLNGQDLDVGRFRARRARHRRLVLVLLRRVELVLYARAT